MDLLQYLSITIVMIGILSSTDYLVDNKFSVADVAVASYLNYVPVFFGSVNPVNRPNLARYMLRCAQRPAFAAAFGDGHAEAIIRKAPGWIDGSAPNPKKGWFP